MVGEFGLAPDAIWVNDELEKHRHRGPDNTTMIQISPRLIMGANRLAMVDRLARSNQPLQSHLSNSAITFNGEIYNYKSLRSELQLEGIKFDTESDTEVLLLGLEVYGPEFLERVNGMFAFVYYDSIKNRLILSRDSLGKKPLFLSRTQTGFRWSSNLSSLQTRPFTANTDAIECYLRFGYVIDPLGAVNSVQALTPGVVREIDLVTLNEVRRIAKPKPTCMKKDFRELLTSAVETRVYGNDPIAISLSGGLDSTIIAIICKNLGLNLKTYTAKWSDSDKIKYNDDASRAKQIAKLLEIEHKEVEMLKVSELPTQLRKFVKVMEEPNNNPTGISMLNLYASMKQDDIRLALTGDGADELFLGYTRYKKSSYFPKIVNFQTKYFMESKNATKFKYLSRLFSVQFNESNFSFWATWHEVFTHSELEKMLNRRIPRQDHRFFQEFEGLKSNQIYKTLQSQDLLIWIGMESNRRLDRISMYNSIEARSPFLDNEVVEYAFARGNGFVSKKEFFLKEFPELKNLPVLAEKSGFSSPIGHWLRANSNFIDTQMKYLIAHHGFNAFEIHNLMKSPTLGNFVDMKKLWTLLILSSWLETFTPELTI